MAEDARLSVVIQVVDRATSQLRGVFGTLETNARAFRATGVALSAFGAAGVLVGRQMVGAFLEQERALRTLQTVVENSGQAWAQHQQQVMAVTAALQRKTAVADQEQVRVLSMMVPILGSVDAALAALPSVLDVAAVSGLGLETAARGVAEALTGQSETIMRTGLEFDKAMGPVGRLLLLQQKLGGAAEAAADPVARLGANFDTLKQQLGAGLMPALSLVLGALGGLVDLLRSLNPVVLAVGGTVAVSAVAFATLVGPFLLLVGLLPKIVEGVVLLSRAMAVARVVTFSWLLPILAAAAAIEGLFRAMRAFQNFLLELQGRPPTTQKTPFELMQEGVRNLFTEMEKTIPAAEGMGRTLDVIARRASAAGGSLDGLKGKVAEVSATVRSESTKVFDAVTGSFFPALAQVGVALAEGGRKVANVADMVLANLNPALTQAQRELLITAQRQLQAKMATGELTEALNFFATHNMPEVIDALQKGNLTTQEAIQRYKALRLELEVLEAVQRRVIRTVDAVTENFSFQGSAFAENEFALFALTQQMVDFSKVATKSAADAEELASQMERLATAGAQAAAPPQAEFLQRGQFYPQPSLAELLRGIPERLLAIATERFGTFPGGLLPTVNVNIDGRTVATVLGSQAERAEQVRSS